MAISVGGTLITFPDGSTLAGSLNRGSPVTLTGASIDITSIPSWVRRIMLNFVGASQSGGVGAAGIQLGTLAGGIENTGYFSSATYSVTANTVGSAASTSGFVLTSAMAAATLFDGMATLTNFGSNLWTMSSAGLPQTSGVYEGFGRKTLTGVLDRVRILPIPADTWDAGTVQIMWE